MMTMAITLQCPRCMKEQTVDDDKAGREVPCKICYHMIQVGAARGQAKPTLNPAKAGPKKPRSRPSATSIQNRHSAAAAGKKARPEDEDDYPRRRTRRDEDDDDEDDQPRSRRPQQSDTSPAMAGIGIGLAISATAP